MAKVILVLVTLFSISCNNPIINGKSKTDLQKQKMLVNELKNVEVHELPSDLTEISGITFLDSNTILGIQDEEGILYEYNLKNKEIINKFEFGEPDDYEDLVRVNEDVYVISSNGNIIQIKDFKSANPKIKTLKTALKKKNDIEGLTYEPKRNRLLLAAKASGLADDEQVKEIYAFDLKTMMLETRPAYSIKLNEIEKYFEGDPIVESSKKFLKAIGNHNMNKVFRSSALTVHPQTNQIFVLSSINNIIAVLTPEGKLSQIIKFDGKDYTQPEGIAFSANNKLYISNEGGKNGKGNIIELEYAN